MAAQLIIRRGRREARGALIFGDVVRAIRFLSRPNQPSQVVKKKIELLLSMAQESEVLEPIMPDAAAEKEFIGLLETAATAGQTEQLTARCAELASGLEVKRGPKISAASSAHQFFLQHLPTDRAYTYDPSLDDFVDPQTEATRLEFSEPTFDPRPAYRRTKSARKG
jgi:hypothetical protein